MLTHYAATYSAYLERKKKEGKKPLSRAEWEARTQGGKAAGPHPKGNKPAKTWKKKYSPKVESVMDNHALTDDDANQVREFKSDKPSSGIPVSPTQLMQRFLAKAKPETRERMKGMTPAEFMQMLGAIMEDEEGAGKTASLRTRLIRLAAANPELRADLLPLLKEDANPASVDQNKPESYYGLAPRGSTKTAGHDALVDYLLNGFEHTESLEEAAQELERLGVPKNKALQVAEDWGMSPKSGGVFATERLVRNILSKYGVRVASRTLGPGVHLI